MPASGILAIKEGGPGLTKNGSHLSDRRSSRYQYSRTNLDNLDEIQKSTENSINMRKSIAYSVTYAISDESEQRYEKRSAENGDHHNRTDHRINHHILHTEAD